jgi:hypothetical protein
MIFMQSKFFAGKMYVPGLMKFRYTENYCTPVERGTEDRRPETEAGFDPADFREFALNRKI